MLRLRYRRARSAPLIGRRLAALLGAVVMVTVLPAAETAGAAVPPARDRTAGTVTADALPTVQINGVVWAQAMIGNVVYAGGEFTSARPAGAAAGTNQTPRKNLLAYNITTGALVTTFVPGAFNGAIRTLAVSADKKTLYVGGSFTKVGTTKRGRFAALNVSTGALKSAKPSFNGTVNALAVNSKTVYAGGAFTAVNSKARSRLASVKASNGKLTGWKAKANAGVHALLLTSKSKLLVAGGMFTKLNSTAASGSGAVSPTTGKTKTWKANKVVKNGTPSSAILSLATDGSTVYAAGYAYVTGTFEGVYAASGKDGTLRWLQDCHGDTYGVTAIGDVVYSVGHAHYCENIGGFPDSVPRVEYRALAVTKAAAGTVGKNGQTSSSIYTNYEGKPAPALINWFPDLAAGTYSGLGQAAWSVVGNSKYISLGGEFPKVNGTPQQGLVRMAVSSAAPNKVGPTGSESSLALAASVDSEGKVAINWRQLWDRDDLKLTYRLYREGDAPGTRAAIGEWTASVPFWKRGTMSFTDTDAASAGSSTVRYQVTVSDPRGNTVRSATISVTLPAQLRAADSASASPSPTPSASAERTPSATPTSATPTPSAPEARPPSEAPATTTPASTRPAASVPATTQPATTTPG